LKKVRGKKGKKKRVRGALGEGARGGTEEGRKCKKKRDAEKRFRFTRLSQESPPA